MTWYVVMALVPWDALKTSSGFDLGAGQMGSIGFLPTFTSYEAASAFADGNYPIHKVRGVPELSVGKAALS